MNDRRRHVPVVNYNISLRKNCRQFCFVLQKVLCGLLMIVGIEIWLSLPVEGCNPVHSQGACVLIQAVVS